MGSWDDGLNWIKWFTIGEAVTLAARVEGAIDIPKKIPVRVFLAMIRYKESENKVEAWISYNQNSSIIINKRNVGLKRKK